MAEILVADYSGGKPGAKALRDAGFVGAVRYIGYPDNPKCATAAEFFDFDGHGMGMALVHERDVGDWWGGFAAGRDLARLARQHANTIGFPQGRPIYMAVDTDVETADEFELVAAYLDGAASVLGRENTGVYGEFDVIERMVPGHAAFGWQTAAWSASRLTTKANLYQRAGQTYAGGVQCDMNVVMLEHADWGSHLYRPPLPPITTTEDNVSTLAPAGDDQHVELIVAGKKRLYLASAWGETVDVSAILFYADTGNDPTGSGVGGGYDGFNRDQVWRFEPNRPGPISIPDGATMATIRYTAAHSFAVGAV